MLRRRIDKVLEDWKRTKGNECLLVRGARQVGKTFSIREFGKRNYGTFIEINFIESPIFISAFDNALDSDTIIRQIALRFPGFRIEEGNTLIFLDEIQQCPNARTALKFLASDRRFDVVASGSLISILGKDTLSIPVGYERELTMYPLSFEEYLWARGYGEDALGFLRTAFSDPSILDASLVSLYGSLLDEYLMTGGMPAVVNASLRSSSWEDVMKAQRDIYIQNLDDIEKYSKGAERERIRLALNGILDQSGNGRKAFSYAQIEKGHSRARDYMPAVEWLAKAELIYPSDAVSSPEIPLSMYTEQGTRRFYFYDIGIFFAIVSGETPLLRNTIMNSEWKGPAKGRFYESLAADLLHKNGHRLFYYDIPQKLEIDFMIETEEAILPIEVKSGNNKASSLGKLLSRYGIPEGLKLTGSSCGKADGITTLPLFMAAFL